MKIFKKILYLLLKKKKYLSNNKPIGRYKCIQDTLFIGNGVISLNNTTLGYFPSAYYDSTYNHIEARSENSKIIIDEGTIINNNANIVANDTTISIGKLCRIGTNFCCFDSDFHGLTVSDRDNPNMIISQSVNIGNNVFIGHNVTVLKGVSLGDGCVVGAGSVVTKSFPENSIIAGNPAKLIRKIDNVPETLMGVERVIPLIRKNKIQLSKVA